MRIVSLLGSATDLLVELGAAAELVGRSHECDAPAVAHLPVLSRPTFDISGSSAEIDALVRARLRAGQPLYEVDEAALAALRPDVVITQTHCEVCSVSARDLQGDRCPRVPVLSFMGGSLAGVREDFRALCQVIERQEDCARLLAGLDLQLAALAARVPRTRVRVAGIEWLDPLFSMGNWGPELIRLAGGEPVLGEAGGASGKVSFAELEAADPDVLVLAPCGWDLSRTRAEMPALSRQPGFSRLRAVRTGRIFIADGSRYFNRSSPDLFRTPALLADMLHGDSTAGAGAVDIQKKPHTASNVCYARWVEA